MDAHDSSGFVRCQIPWPFLAGNCAKSPYCGCQFEGGEVMISTENGGKIKEMGHWQMLIDGISGLIADFLRLIDVNAGGLRLQKGEGILHLRL